MKAPIVRGIKVNEGFGMKGDQLEVYFFENNSTKQNRTQLL